MRRASSFALATIAFAMVVLSAAPAGAATVRVFPPDSEVRGADMQTWAERWGRYAFEPGVAENPLVNATNCDLSIQMVHGVIFLPASGGGSLKVECTIPARHPLLLTPGGAYGVQPYDGDTLEEIRSTVENTYIAGTSQVRAYVDGHRVEDIDQYLTHSDGLFVLNATADTILCCDVQPGPTNVFLEGWFLMLKPYWNEGTHRIRVHDTLTAPDGSTTDATVQYVLHVED